MGVLSATVIDLGLDVLSNEATHIVVPAVLSMLATVTAMAKLLDEPERIALAEILRDGAAVPFLGLGRWHGWMI